MGEWEREIEREKEKKIDGNYDHDDHNKQFNLGKFVFITLLSYIYKYILNYRLL